MLEIIHSLTTEADLLGVSPSTLSEAVSKGRRCSGRDVLDRARFDAGSGRCIGFVPARSYADEDLPVPTPLTLTEMTAVREGSLTVLQAEAEARLRIAASVALPQPQSGTFGLTKREMFAAMVLQGLCASFSPGRKIEGVAVVTAAVDLAELLVDELNAPHDA